MNSPTEMMWQMVSELLEGELLPETMNETLKQLCDGTAIVVKASEAQPKTE